MSISSVVHYSILFNDHTEFVVVAAGGPSRDQLTKGRGQLVVHAKFSSSPSVRRAELVGTRRAPPYDHSIESSRDIIK